MRAREGEREREREKERERERERDDAAHTTARRLRVEGNTERGSLRTAARERLRTGAVRAGERESDRDIRRDSMCTAEPPACIGESGTER